MFTHGFAKTSEVLDMQKGPSGAWTHSPGHAPVPVATPKAPAVKPAGAIVPKAGPAKGSTMGRLGRAALGFAKRNPLATAAGVGTAAFAAGRMSKKSENP